MDTSYHGAGLRVREVMHLKVTDFSFEENIGWVNFCTILAWTCKA